MEEMVEAIIALCDCPPERTGLTHVSLDLLSELAIRVHGLDGLPLAELTEHVLCNTSDRRRVARLHTFRRRRGAARRW